MQDERGGVVVRRVAASANLHKHPTSDYTYVPTGARAIGAGST